MAEEAGAAPAVPDEGNTCLANKRDDLASRLSSIIKTRNGNGGARGGSRTRTASVLSGLSLLLDYAGEKVKVVLPTGLSPATSAFEARHSIH